MWAPWKKSAERERGDEPSWSREIMAAPLGRDTLPDYWSYGVCRDGRVFFIKWAVLLVLLWVLYEAMWRDFFLPPVVLLAFSNRCLSCSDKTQSTTWLHPRTGEPVNSGHMIRSGTPQIIWFCRIPAGYFAFAAVCSGSLNVFLLVL